jgi:hypothetical protein
MSSIRDLGSFPENLPNLDAETNELPTPDGGHDLSDAQNPPWGNDHAGLENFLTAIYSRPIANETTASSSESEEAGTSTNFILSVDGSRSSPSQSASVEVGQSVENQSGSELGVSTRYALSLDGTNGTRSEAQVDRSSHNGSQPDFIQAGETDLKRRREEEPEDEDAPTAKRIRK